MKGSDKIEMTINIGGELIKLDVPFDDQNSVRDTERDVKIYFEKYKKNWPDHSDKNILAMVAYQYAKWYHQLLDIQSEAIENIKQKAKQIDDWATKDQSENEEEPIFL